MYIGLILVEQNGENFLFRTPAWSCFEIGDTVVVEGEKTGKVINTVNGIRIGDPMLKFIIETANAKTPLPKVLGRLDYIECRYLEGEEDGEYSEE